MVNIYIQTSIKTLKRQNGTVGYVIEAEGQEARPRFGYVMGVTRNQAELLGLKFALKDVPTKDHLLIHTDNQFIAAAFTQGWLTEWAENGWKTAKDKEVVNRKEWECILQELDGAIPDFRVNEPHSYKSWLIGEVERRAKKYV